MDLGRILGRQQAFVLWCQSHQEAIRDKPRAPASHKHTSTKMFHLTTASEHTAASLVAQRLKRLPAMRETWVQSLGWEDPLEKEMATHSSTLAWKIPWMGEPGSPWGCKEPDTTERGHFLSF